VRNKQIFH